MKTRADIYEEGLRRTWPDFTMSAEARKKHNERFSEGYSPFGLRENEDTYNEHLNKMGYRS